MFNIATNPAAFKRALGIDAGDLLPLAKDGVVKERRAVRREYLKMDDKSLMDEFASAMHRDASESARNMANTHWAAPIKRLLDSTTTYGGSVLPRVDLEDMLYAIFLKKFPYWERMRNKPANGLRHTWNIIKTPGQASVTDASITASSDTSVAVANTAQYAQVQTSTIAEFLEQRGVSFREAIATEQSGMTYNPEQSEIEQGIVRLKDAIQRMIFQGNGNAGYTSGTASQEQGLYNANGFDGLRIISAALGSSGYSQAAVQLDQDKTNKTILQACNTVAGRTINNGADPSDIVLSATAHAALMDEQEGKQRAFGTMEIQPGLSVTTINTVAGPLPLLPVPGTNAIGQYNRTSDGVAVEDIYVLDSHTISRVWLGGPDINVLELPAGISGALTRTFLIFHFASLEVADTGAFQGKVRIPQTLF